MLTLSVHGRVQARKHLIEQASEHHDDASSTSADAGVTGRRTSVSSTTTISSRTSASTSATSWRTDERAAGDETKLRPTDRLRPRLTSICTTVKKLEQQKRQQRQQRKLTRQQQQQSPATKAKRQFKSELSHNVASRLKDDSRTRRMNPHLYKQSYIDQVWVDERQALEKEWRDEGKKLPLDKGDGSERNGSNKKSRKSSSEPSAAKRVRREPESILGSVDVNSAHSTDQLWLMTKRLEVKCGGAKSA
ncbi:hypothetical protein ACM66B_002221 [Microbotryomycetes sp. NB124-2]